MKTQQQIEERAWAIALGHYLSEYPENNEPEKIIELVENNSASIMYWEPFEYCNPQWMSDQIWTMKTYMVSELAWATEEGK